MTTWRRPVFALSPPLSGRYTLPGMSDHPLLSSWLLWSLLWFFPVAGLFLWFGFPGRRQRLLTLVFLVAGPWLFVNLAMLAEPPDNGLAQIIAVFLGFLYAVPGLFLFVLLYGAATLLKHFRPDFPVFMVRHRASLLLPPTLVLAVPAALTIVCPAPESYLKQRALHFLEHSSGMHARPLIRVELGKLVPVQRDWMGRKHRFELPAVIRRLHEPEQHIRLYMNRHGHVYGYDNIY